MTNRYQPDLYIPGSEMEQIKKETVRHDQDIEDKYTDLTSRKRELGAELNAVNGELDLLLASLGELVASGENYKKQLARLQGLRSQFEALEAGIVYLKGQCDLMRRMNTWLKI